MIQPIEESKSTPKQVEDSPEREAKMKRLFE